MTLSKHGDIGVITIDAPEQKLNMASAAALTELGALNQQIQDDDDIKAVVIISAKESNFIAGADINELSSFTTKKAAEKAVRAAQALFNDIESSKKPYIAAIHGACMGGGLELALACQMRIASLHRQTTFALPEVNLGFLPAAGGTQRLPRVIGIMKALPLLLFGKRIGCKEARALGLVDKTVETREQLFSSALACAKAAVDKPKTRVRKPFLWSVVPLIIARRRVLKQTKGHYPAPLAIIDVMTTGIMRGMQAGLNQEARQFGELVHTTTSKNLVRLFFAQKARQKNGYQTPSTKLSHIGIIGAGLMGTGIASVSIARNFHVDLSDTNANALTRAQTTIWGELSQRVNQGQIAKIDRNRMMTNLSASTTLENIIHADVVIEAIVEDLEAKQALLKSIETQLANHAIFATNTSSIPIKEIAEHSAIKDRIVGMHYFSPVQKMPLLEIVKSPHTSRETLAIACEIGVRQGKAVIVVNDSAGFYTTRIIAALMDEASVLLSSGHSLERIDYAMTQMGFPIGPVALMDEVGIDVLHHASRTLHFHFGARLVAADMRMSEVMIENGWLGRKSGKGHYHYNKHKKRINQELSALLKAQFAAHQEQDANIAERMLLRMVNEAAYCLSERIVENTEDADVGAVFGVGFPPYLGGPFKYIDNRGKKSIATSLKRLHQKHGIRFTPAPFFDRAD